MKILLTDEQLKEASIEWLNRILLAFKNKNLEPRPGQGEEMKKDIAAIKRTKDLIKQLS